MKEFEKIKAENITLKENIKSLQLEISHLKETERQSIKTQEIIGCVNEKVNLLEKYIVNLKKDLNSYNNDSSTDKPKMILGYGLSVEKEKYIDLKILINDKKASELLRLLIDIFIPLDIMQKMSKSQILNDSKYGQTLKAIIGSF